MKVSCAFILKLTGLGAMDFGEVDNSAESLDQRYMPINGCSAIIEVEVPKTPKSSNWKDAIDKDEKLSWYKFGIPKYTEKYPNIGMFVVSHGCSGKVGGLDGGDLANLIKEFQFKNLRKISIVACSTGAGDFSGDTAPDGSFFGLLCNGLAPELTPMVAAYTGYVTVGSPKSDVTALYSQNGGTAESKEEFIKLMQNGHKLIRTKNGKGKNMAATKANDAWKAKQKIAYQFKDNAVRSISLSTWHDA